MLFCYIIGLSCLSLKTDPNEQSTDTCFENNSLRTEAVKFQKSIQSMHDCHTMTQGKIQRHTQVFIDIYIKTNYLNRNLKLKLILVKSTNRADLLYESQCASSDTDMKRRSTAEDGFVWRCSSCSCSEYIVSVFNYSRCYHRVLSWNKEVE